MTFEELIIDDSFINYCLKRNKQDIAVWETYLLQNPEEQGKLEEAASFVSSLHDILKTVKEPAIPPSIGIDTGFSSSNYNDQKGSFSLFRFKRRWAWAAVVFVLIGLWAFAFFQLKSNEELAPSNFASSEATPKTEAATHLKEDVVGNPGIFSTGVGEKKTIYLPDNTKIVLNAMSSLRVDSDFGKLNRNVFIEGEALFDVAHNKMLPFIVETKHFFVKALGTEFNIRSYNNDRQDEAALLRGKIELTVKNKNTADNRLILKPLQKVFVNRDGISGTAVVSGSRLNKLSLNASTLELNKESETKLLETAWVYDRLEFEDDYFEDIAARLERKFGVAIVFKDEFVKKFKYNAVFEKENINEILMFLSSSLPFVYEIEGKTITIKK